MISLRSCLWLVFRLIKPGCKKIHRIAPVDGLDPLLVFREWFSGPQIDLANQTPHRRQLALRFGDQPDLVAFLVLAGCILAKRFVGDPHVTISSVKLDQHKLWPHSRNLSFFCHRIDRMLEECPIKIPAHREMICDRIGTTAASIILFGDVLQPPA